MDNDPYVWGGQVEEAQSSMGSYELEQGGPVDFGYELPVAGAGEEVAVYLGELRQATEEPARPTARWAAECGVPSQAGSEATTSVELTALAHITTIEELRAEYRKAMAERQGRASEAELRRAVLDADIAYTERLYFRELDKRLRPLGIGVPAQLLKLQPYIRPRAAGLERDQARRSEARPHSALRLGDRDPVKLRGADEVSAVTRDPFEGGLVMRRAASVVGAIWRQRRTAPTHGKMKPALPLREDACDCVQRITDVAREEGDRSDHCERDDGQDYAVFGHRLSVLAPADGSRDGLHEGEELQHL